VSRWKPSEVEIRLERFDWEAGGEATESEGVSPAGREHAVTEQELKNHWLGVLVLIAVEAMLFLMFIFAFLYLRAQGEPWPPPGVSRQDLGLPILNVLVLLASALVAYGAEHSIRHYWITVAERRLLVAAGLGLLFLAGQFREYAVLFLQGITPATGLYGALFYVTIGFHGAHVMSGLIWLVAVWYSTRAARQTPERHLGVRAATLYWGFVSSVWIVLFLLLYMI
jgi:cytochrome c oxidase subunit III